MTRSVLEVHFEKAKRNVNPRKRGDARTCSWCALQPDLSVVTGVACVGGQWNATSVPASDKLL